MLEPASPLTDINYYSRIPLLILEVSVQCPEWAQRSGTLQEEVKMVNYYVAKKMYADFPWLWAVRSGYYPGDCFRVKELGDEFNYAGGIEHWLIVDLGNHSIQVVPVAPSAREGRARLLRAIEWQGRQVPERTIRYIARNTGSGEYIILRPPKEKSFIDIVRHT